MRSGSNLDQLSEQTSIIIPDSGDFSELIFPFILEHVVAVASSAGAAFVPYLVLVILPSAPQEFRRQARIGAAHKFVLVAASQWIQ
jgi:hypothetical protein